MFETDPSNGCILGPCGFINPEKSEKIYTMLKAYFQALEDKPSVISVGSGYGYHEFHLKEKVGLDVVCYDQENKGCLLRCYCANFPEDNASIIPENCSNKILFSAYPEGYLGQLLKLYKEKGGTKLCVVVEGTLYSKAHLNYEPDYRSHCAVDLRASCLLTLELVDLEKMGVTSFSIGERVSGQQRAVSNMVFYGDWEHEKLQEFLPCQQLNFVAGASGYRYGI